MFGIVVAEKKSNFQCFRRPFRCISLFIIVGHIYWLLSNWQWLEVKGPNVVSKQQRVYACIYSNVYEEDWVHKCIFKEL